MDRYSFHHLMNVTSTTDDGFPIQCEICGQSSIVNVSRPPGDSVCPCCGSFLWVQAISEIRSQQQLIPDIRIRELTARDKPSAIQEMVDAVSRELGWNALRADQLFTKVMKREELGSTGIGRGIAVPHAKTDWADSCITAIALAPDGIDIDSRDGLPIHTLILVVSPTSKPGDHLRLLERISRTTRFLG